MPTTRKPQRQPIAAFIYTAIPGLVIAFFIFVLGTSAGLSAALDGAGTPHLGATILATTFAAAAFCALYPILYYYFFTYELEEYALTVHSGIIFKDSDTINFARIQLIENQRGPILMILGLTAMKVWTASPDQMAGIGQGQHPRPDAKILLKKSDAESIRDFMSRTGATTL